MEVRLPNEETARKDSTATLKSVGCYYLQRPPFIVKVTEKLSKTVTVLIIAMVNKINIQPATEYHAQNWMSQTFETIIQAVSQNIHEFPNSIFIEYKLTFKLIV